MHASLEDVEFIARSPSRVTVLDAVHDEPRTRDELKAVTDASRTTLSRMLAAFEDRGWLERVEHHYRLTPEGEYLAGEVVRLLDNLDTAATLDGTLGWLPVEAFDFDLRRLDDAEVLTLPWNDPAAMRGLAEELSGADRVRSITVSVSREVVDLLATVTIEGGATYEGILTARALEIAREHPELRRQLAEISALDRASIYRYDGGSDPAMVMAIDDQATICNHGSDGPAMEAIISEDDAVRTWVDRYVDSIRADATRLDPGTFDPLNGRARRTRSCTG